MLIDIATALRLHAKKCAQREPEKAQVRLSNKEVRSALSRAEALMTQAPDSALMLLEDIDGGALRGRENRAHYALLYSQALDKNYIDRTNDSIIRVAVDYYSMRKNEPEKLFLSYYYLGRVQHNAAQLTRAMLSYGRAEELISELSDDYAIGLLYAQMGNLYKEVYDLPKSLASYQKAYSHYKTAKKNHHMMMARIDEAVVYLDLNQQNTAEQILKESLLTAHEQGDYQSCHTCITFLLRLYTTQQDVVSLKELLEGPYLQLCNDSLEIARAYLYHNIYADHQKSAYQSLKNLEKKTSNSSDNIDLMYAQYKYHKHFNQYKEALAIHENLYYAQDTLVRGILQQPLLSAQRDYFKAQSELNEIKFQHNKRMTIWVSVMLSLIVLISSLYIRQLLINKTREINEYLDMVQDLENNILLKEKNLQEISESYSQMNEQINNLFAKQFATIDQLCITYYEMQSAKNNKEAIYKSVKKEIEKFSSNKKTLQDLEDIVNQHKNNVMSILRQEFPEFDEMDFRLLCYSLAGFSAKAISVFTGNSTNNIYTRKSRLKTIVANKHSSNKNIYVKYLLKTNVL